MVLGRQQLKNTLTVTQRVQQHSGTWPARATRDNAGRHNRNDGIVVLGREELQNTLSVNTKCIHGIVALAGNNIEHDAVDTKGATAWWYVAGKSFKTQCRRHDRYDGTVVLGRQNFKHTLSVNTKRVQRHSGAWPARASRTRRR